MSFRRILTGALLLFVASGILTLAVKGFRGVAGPSGSDGVAGRESLEGGRQVIAYYFLGKVRCSSCRKIEETAGRTIGESFRKELDSRRLRFLVVNVDEPGNRHYVQDFGLESSTLVLVEMRDGKPVEWKKLPEVWTLVEDVPRLEKYIRDEIRSKLRDA